VNRDFSVSLLISVFVHAALFFFLSSVMVQQAVTPLLTNMTVVGVMPFGEGLGQIPKAAAGENEKKIAVAGKKPGKTKVLLPRTAEQIEKLRTIAPIGIQPDKERTDIGPVSVRDSVPGQGNEPGRPGSPLGQPGITGQLAQRGIKYSYRPAYPEWAKRQGTEGEVRLKITVTPAGLVQNVTVFQTSGNRDLDQVAVASIRKWLFDPLPENFDQTYQEGIVTFRFQLDK